MNSVLIWGGTTGQAGVVYAILKAQSFKVEVLIDIDEKAKKSIPAEKYIFGREAINNYFAEGKFPHYFVIAVASDGEERCRIDTILRNKGILPLTVIHPSAWVAESANISEGCQILGMAAISENVQLGIQTIVNTNSTVDHDTVVGKGCHIMPAATLTGCIEVGDFVSVGSNSTILPRLKVTDKVIIGAGAVVTKNLDSRDIYAGIPAIPLNLLDK